MYLECMGYRTDLSVGIHSTYLLKQHCLLKRVMRGEPTGRMLTASISTSSRPYQ